MKLFISYSRDDKAWTFELGRQIRDQLNDDVWIDQRLVAAQDWWRTICENIENADVFLFVMTPKSVESIYCVGELEYALALNKPILPLMLKSCNYPEELYRRRIQYLRISDDMNMDKVLLNITKGLRVIEQEDYIPQKSPRPDVPSPKQNPEHVFEVFALAEEAVAENNTSLAEKLFTQVIDADIDGQLGYVAKNRISQIILERDRAVAYLNVKRLADNPKTLHGARAAWQAFERTYPHYDPDNLAILLDATEKTSSYDQPRKLVVQERHSLSSSIPDPATTALLRARTFAGANNQDWEPHITSFDHLRIPDMPFCLVPIGSFYMGDDSEKPVHKQWIGQPYWIGQYPVTNKQWKQAVDAGVVDPPRDTGASLKWYNDPLMADAPVVGVNWFMVREFVTWLGARLPTELEWEYAARGVESLRYAWGNQWNPAYLSWEQNSGGKPAPISDYSKGRSWVGALHMCGNVWEWTSSLYNAYPYQVENDWERNARDTTGVRRVLRGGSYN